MRAESYRTREADVNVCSWWGRPAEGCVQDYLESELVEDFSSSRHVCQAHGMDKKNGKDEVFV